MFCSLELSLFYSMKNLYLYTYLMNKLLHGWFVCTIVIIYSLSIIPKLTLEIRKIEIKIMSAGRTIYIFHMHIWSLFTHPFSIFIGRTNFFCNLIGWYFRALIIVNMAPGFNEVVWEWSGRFLLNFSPIKPHFYHQENAKS